MSSTQVVKSSGIFHGINVFPELKGLTAVVAGASGISGQYMLNVLAESPERWDAIHALSRTAPEIPLAAKNLVKHVPVDLLASPADISEILKKNGVTADYVFFFAYLQPPPAKGSGLWTNQSELGSVNGKRRIYVHTNEIVKLLSNTLQAIRIASLTPKRVVLQTGLKTYGNHLGPVNVPLLESDPRVTLDENFYYPQEDFLADFYKGTDTTWAVTIPGWILGAVKGAAMNILYPLAIYASVQKQLGRKLLFPSDMSSWDRGTFLSSAHMNAYMAEWAALTPAAANERYNITDGSIFTWSRFWPILASWYGVSWEPPKAEGYTEIESFGRPRGYGQKGTIRLSFSLLDWAAQPEVQKAWSQITKTHSIQGDPFSDIERIFLPLQYALANPGGGLARMSKAVKAGWHGYVESTESIRQIFEKLAQLKMVPEVPKGTDAPVEVWQD